VATQHRDEDPEAATQRQALIARMQQVRAALSTCEIRSLQMADPS